MAITRLQLLGASLLCFALTAAAQGEGLRILAFEPVHLDWQTNSADLRADGKPVSVSGLTFDAFGHRLTARLERRTQLEQALGTVHARAYAGHLDALPGSWIRVTVTGDDVDALLFDGHDLYVIAPARQVAGNLVPPLLAGAHEVVFRLRDTLLDLSTDCTVAKPRSAGASDGQATWEAMTRELAAATQGTVELNLGVVADAALAESAGSDALVRDRLAARLNNVEGIFASQLGVRIHVADVVVLDRASDPLSATTAAQTLLREFADKRSRIPGLRGTGLAHLVTGRDLDGDTVGVAYLDTVCDAKIGVSLAQNRGRSTAYESLITAHELGHNFGAPHDGEAGPCASTPQTWLMAPRINGNDLFSECSRTQIAPRIAAAACLTPVATSQLAFEPVDARLRLATGDAGTVSVMLSNLGAAAAPTPRLTGTATGSVFLVGANARSGTCTTTSNQFDCDLDDLPAQASASITITARGDAAGIAAIDLHATSGDSLSGDATSQVIVTVEDGVDLRVDLSAAQRVAVGESLAATALITHVAGSRASNVAISFRAEAGTTIRGARLDDGSCVVTAASVECRQPLLDPLGETVLSVELDVARAGSWQLTAAVAADQLERSPDDNISSVTVVATSAASASASSGGGGCASLACLALLGCGCLRRSAQQRRGRRPQFRAASVSSQRASAASLSAPD